MLEKIIPNMGLRYSDLEKPAKVDDLARREHGKDFNKAERKDLKSL